MTSALAVSDTAKYAESLRTSLRADLFDGEAVDYDEDEGGAIDAVEGGRFTVEDYIGTSSDALQDVEADLDAFADNDIIKGERDDNVTSTAHHRPSPGTQRRHARTPLVLGRYSGAGHGGQGVCTWDRREAEAGGDRVDPGSHALPIHPHEAGRKDDFRSTAHGVLAHGV